MDVRAYIVSKTIVHTRTDYYGNILLALAERWSMLVMVKERMASRIKNHLTMKELSLILHIITHLRNFFFLYKFICVQALKVKWINLSAVLLCYAKNTFIFFRKNFTLSLKIHVVTSRLKILWHNTWINNIWFDNTWIIWCWNELQKKLLSS